MSLFATTLTCIVGVYLHYIEIAWYAHFLPKKAMMLPCPGFAAPFFAPLAAGAGVGLAFFGTGSSSENDSHAASSLVTIVH
jgi:hypothetical protein